MRRSTQALVVLVLLTNALSVGAQESGTVAEPVKTLTLTIKQKGRNILGTVRNTSGTDVQVRANFLGWWEFTTVLYFDGQRWHEAPLKKRERPSVGAAEAIILKPNGHVTFSVDLNEYEFPVARWQNKIRLVTQDLWSNIADLKTPDEAPGATQ